MNVNDAHPMLAIWLVIHVHNTEVMHQFCNTWSVWNINRDWENMKLFWPKRYGITGEWGQLLSFHLICVLSRWWKEQSGTCILHWGGGWGAYTIAKFVIWFSYLLLAYYYEKKTNKPRMYNLIIAWPCSIDINNIDNQLDSTITVY